VTKQFRVGAAALIVVSAVALALDVTRGSSPGKDVARTTAQSAELAVTGAERAATDEPLPASDAGVSVRHGAAVDPAEYDGNLRTIRGQAEVNGSATPKPPERIEAEEPEPLASKFTAPQGHTTIPSAPLVPAVPSGAPTPTVSFNGLDFATWGAGHPPDTVGAVGRGFYVQAVNTAIGIWSKTGGAPLTAFTFNTLWSGARTGTACDTNNQGDPTVIYDHLADRYIVADFAWTNIQDGPYYECIAVSKSSDPVTGGWYLYGVRADDASHPWLPDYPKMGLWPDGIYMTSNMFDCTSANCGSSTYKEVRVYAFNRTDLESGATLRSVVVDQGSNQVFSLLPSNLSGSTLPPGGRNNLLVSESFSLYAFEVWKFHPDYGGAGTTFSSRTNVSQTAYNSPAGVPSSGNTLDSIGDRMMMQNQYSNIGGTESLWVNHTVRTSASGPDGIQWAQIDVTGGTVATTPAQQQIYGNLGSDGLGRWMGSLAVDHLGDVALGYSTSKASVNPDIRYTGRLVGDTANTLPQGETTLQTGGGSQSGNCGSSACARWGDYSAMTLDPNGCTFWYTNMYYATAGLNWQTRVGAFRYPSCTALATPSIATSLSASTVTVGTAVTDKATLSSASSDAGGTVAYTVYPSIAACVGGSGGTDEGTVTVTNGVVPRSANFTPAAVGTYAWQAVYRGDANNVGVSSVCTDGQLAASTVHPSSFQVSIAPSLVAAGTPASVSVTARSGSGVLTTFAGPVTYTDLTGQHGTLALTWSNGVGVGTLVITTPRNSDVVTVTDGFGTGRSAAFKVFGTVDHFSVNSAPSQLNTGDTLTVRATALDVNNSAVANYAGTPSLSSAAFATTVMSCTAGLCTKAVTATLPSAGTRAQVTDNAAAGTGEVFVVIGPLAAFQVSVKVSAKNTVKACTPLEVSVRAVDAAGSLVTTYSGALTATDSVGGISGALTVTWRLGRANGTITPTRRTSSDTVTVQNAARVSGTSTAFAVTGNDCP